MSMHTGMESREGLCYGAEAVRAVGAKDRVVGVTDTVKERYKLFPELSKLPSVGTYMASDVENIVTLNPDIVFATLHLSR